MLDRIAPDGAELGSYLVAIDSVDAGVGQTVLVIDEGNSARQIVDGVLQHPRSGRGDRRRHHHAPESSQEGGAISHLYAGARGHPEKAGHTEQLATFDHAAAPLGHHGDHCSFDAFIERYDLADPALAALAPIVRGADTDDRALTPESAGLYAFATGFQAIAKDDHDNMAKQFPAYDALYAYCRAAVAGAQ